MQTYSKYSPTGFDSAGSFLPDRQDWLVVPVGRTRDSGPYDESNFETALKMLGGEGDDVEVHRFGHWGPGWFEIIIARPGTKAQEQGEEIEGFLEGYPVLDDEDMSNREYEEFLSGWSDYGASDFRKAIKKCFEMSDEDQDLLDDMDDDKLRQFYMDRAPDPYHCEGSGVCINIDSMIRHMTEDDFDDLMEIADGQKAVCEDPAQLVMEFKEN